MRRSRIGRGSSISTPSSPLPCGSVPDPLHRVGRHADVDELGQSPSGRDHPQRRVARTDQLPGRLHDPPQHHRQGQITGDHLVGPQQPAQPALRAHHLLRPLHQLPQQLVQLQPGQIRERQRSRATGGARGGTGLLRGQRGKRLFPACSIGPTRSVHPRLRCPARLGPSIRARSTSRSSEVGPRGRDDGGDGRSGRPLPVHIGGPSPWGNRARQLVTCGRCSPGSGTSIRHPDVRLLKRCCRGL